MKIIHVSDIHIKSSVFELPRYRAILDDIIHKGYPKDTVVIMTGDLVNHGFLNVFPAKENPAYTGVRYLEEHGYAGRVFVVPGNHDYGVGVKIFDRTRAHRTKLLKEFKTTFYNDSQASFPIIKEIDDCLFIGLDSTEEALKQMNLKNLFTSEGLIGKEQLNALVQAIEQAENKQKKVIVYLHHHPFTNDEGLKLIDSADFLSAIDGKVAMLLFGHVHKDPDWGNDSNLDKNIERVYNAGSSTNMDNYKDWDIFYRVIDLNTVPASDTIVHVPMHTLDSDSDN